VDEQRGSVLARRKGVTDLGWIAFGVTWIVSASRVSPTPEWFGDFTLLRAWSDSAIGVCGIVTDTLSSLVRPIPLGTPAQRYGWIAALGAACIAATIYRLILATLHATSGGVMVERWLALGGALLVTLSASAQTLATTSSGSTLAIFGALAAVWQVVRLLDGLNGSGGSDASLARQALAIGATLGLTWLENPVAGLLGTLVAGSLWTRAATQALLRLKSRFVLGVVFVVVTLGVPFWLARRSFVGVRVERPLWSGLGPWTISGSIRSVWAEWVQALGPVWFGVGLLALLAGMLAPDRGRLRWVLASLLTCLILGYVGLDDTAASHAVLGMVGATAVVAAASKGLRDISNNLARWQPRMAGLGATLAVLSQTVSVLARNDEAAFANDHYRSIGADAWTDEALSQLPAGAVVLVRTRPILEHMLAAQVVDGVRPDLLIVPLERVTEPALVASLVAAEPALLPLIRDITINGRPSENAISSLADARPLFTEFDPRWETRLAEHLLVQPFFHRVYSQTLGRSDRASALLQGQRALARLLATTEPSERGTLSARAAGDRLTRQVIEARLQEQVTLLLALADRQAIDGLLNLYSDHFGQTPWLLAVRQRLQQHPRGSVDAFDLLKGVTPVSLDAR
jgi:hypothetical protein